MTNETMREKTRAAVLERLDTDALVDLARAALRIESLSGQEEGVARLFADSMDSVGMEVELQPVPATAAMSASYNAIGIVRGTGGGASLMFNGHIDHNPVAEGWTRDPFAAVIEDGWLYGFVHMKAANAAYVIAVDALLKSSIEISGDIVVAHVCGELQGGAGTQRLLGAGVRTDYFLLGEPTELQLGLSHTASITAKLHVSGNVRHFSTADRGAMVNAIYEATRIVDALGPSHQHIPSARNGGWLTYEDDWTLKDLPQLNIGSIRGGVGPQHDGSRPALFADRCTLWLDFRIVPGMSATTIADDLAALIESLPGPPIQYALEFTAGNFPAPFTARRDSPVVRSVIDAHQRINGGRPADRESLTRAASDASWLALAGIEGVIYGAAGRYVSRPDERCEVDQLIRAAKVYACVLVDLCA